MRIGYLGALTEQRIGFVEQQYRPCAFRADEGLFQIFFRFADPFRHHLRDIDDQQIDLQFVG